MCACLCLFVYSKDQLVQSQQHANQLQVASQTLKMVIIHLTEALCHTDCDNIYSCTATHMLSVTDPYIGKMQ